jgi:hypothetical protein
MGRALAVVATAALLISLGAGGAGAHDARFDSRVTLKDPQHSHTCKSDQSNYYVRPEARRA